MRISASLVLVGAIASITSAAVIDKRGGDKPLLGISRAPAPNPNRHSAAAAAPAPVAAPVLDEEAGIFPADMDPRLVASIKKAVAGRKIADAAGEAAFKVASPEDQAEYTAYVADAKAHNIAGPHIDTYIWWKDSKVAAAAHRAEEAAWPQEYKNYLASYAALPAEYKSGRDGTPRVSYDQWKSLTTFKKEMEHNSVIADGQPIPFPESSKLWSQYTTYLYEAEQKYLPKSGVRREVPGIETIEEYVSKVRAGQALKFVI